MDNRGAGESGSAQTPEDSQGKSERNLHAERYLRTKPYSQTTERVLQTESDLHSVPELQTKQYLQTPERLLQTTERVLQTTDRVLPTEQDSQTEPYFLEPAAQRLLLHPDQNFDNPDSGSQDYNSGAAMWEMEPGERGGDCDCLGPPPQFLLPPPPRPPLFQPPDYLCSDDPIPDLEACDAEPTIDASYHSNPSFQTPALIAIFSILLTLGIFIGALLIWKHKRKVANLFPCKSAARVPPPAPAALYEDLAELSHRPPDSQLEMLDVKLGTHFPSGYPVSRSPPVFLRSSPGPEPYRPREHEPVYEELHRRHGDSNDSDGDFAGDELSLAGELPPAPCISTIHREASRRPRGRPPTSLPHQRKVQQRPHNARAAEFHEGLLLDALLRLYPTVGTVGAPRVPAWDNCAPHRRLPCEPCAPTACSRDSLGSDSGYSNTTGGTRASSRARRDMNFS